MDTIADARINSFGLESEADAPTSEEVFILTARQLQAVITRALQPLQDEVMELKATVASQGEKIAALEATQDTQADNQLIQLRLIKQLRETATKEPGETEAARAEKIKRYILSQPGRRASYESLRGLLGVDKDLLNIAIRALMGDEPGRYGIVHVPGDKRKRALVMLPK